jgi:hypothetical protein
MIIDFYKPLGQVCYMAMSVDHQTMANRIKYRATQEWEEIKPHEQELVDNPERHHRMNAIYTQIAQFLEQQTQAWKINVDVIYIDTSC